MAEQPEVLVFGMDNSSLETVMEGLRGSCKVTPTQDLFAVLEILRSPGPNACLMAQNASNTNLLLEVGGLLQHFPEAVLLLNSEAEIQWGNQLAHELLKLPETFDHLQFFDAWENAEIVGPNFCPINSVLVSRKQVKTTIRIDDKFYYELTVKPIGTGETKLILATLRDTTEETIQQQKIDAVYKAGAELGDIKPDELLHLNTDDRIELLKSKLLYYTQDLLEYETVEIRLVDQQTKVLTPLLALGMQPFAEERELIACAEGNGVTGFVAATGRSYLCEDTSQDQLYLEGAEGARSSLTVPLVLHDQVLGTFNVESPQTGAFTQNDLQFLELFCREVAVALNTLELLKTEKASMAVESSSRVLSHVADPVDEILNDAAWIYEQQTSGNVNQPRDPEVAEKLRNILNRTQEIRSLILQTSESEVPDAIKSLLPNDYPELRTKRILVVDSELAMRRRAQDMLGRYGCIVDSVNSGEQALRMVRIFHYDAVISDIRPTNFSGSELIRLIREIHEHLPVILATGFGYDGEHTIVNARKLGMKTVLYKPFILKQILKAVSEAVTPNTNSTPE